jgi:hypothetical protein
MSWEGTEGTPGPRGNAGPYICRCARCESFNEGIPGIPGPVGIWPITKDRYVALRLLGYAEVVFSSCDRCPEERSVSDEI